MQAVNDAPLKTSKRGRKRAVKDEQVIDKAIGKDLEETKTGV